MNAVSRVIRSKTNGFGRFYVAFIFCAYVILLAGPAQSASIDEIMAMQDAGVGADIIIDVVDATGLDDPLDSETIVWLVDNGLDADVLTYLLENYYVDSDDESDDDYYDDESANGTHANMRGGEGFHGGSGYNPLRDDERSDNYRNDRYYRNSYQPDNSNYPGIYVYEPPVYILGNNPYRAYRVPRYHSINSSCWGNGYYVINGGGFQYHRNDPCRDNWYGNHHRRGYSDGWYGNLYGDWSWSGRRHRWDIGGNLGWWDDGLRLRISF